ncbi:hypothetical protein B0T24DRAFT_518741 [Lasiosphaeria ovina]|uniref:EF-hand domain-containing protein n=1 Tax=Lasiosphaeria ovina TaxID=92902 RepID=A0AAE0NLN9_9PEZI|nr:hypothetical protein B0T24DRAFT_518741 [Lasiosphaeria ovina]
MAYNRGYNPDELPRFAEPEQKDKPAPSPSLRYENKPPPPRPSEQRPPPTDRYRSERLSPRPQERYQMANPSPTSGGQPSPITVSRPPPSPAPRDTGADPTLLPLFRAVDKDGTGQLSEKELSAALVNGDWTPFDPQTVRMMIRMFDSDRSGTIGFEEFCGLWSFLASWRTLFDRFDNDGNGTISLDEFKAALIAFRYRLTDSFIAVLFKTYDKRGMGGMSFDLFVQACISLKRMTDVFKKYDEDRDGFITLSFEDFLIEILRQIK